MKTYFKLSARLRKIFNYFSIFTIVFGTTLGSINSANAAAVLLANGGGDQSDGIYIGADINEAADTLSNTAAAAVTFQTAAAAIAFDTLITAEDLALTVHPHPTLSETVMESAEVFFGHATHTVPSKR